MKHPFRNMFKTFAILLFVFACIVRGLSAQDKSPTIPQDLQTKVALLALDAASKGRAAEQATEAAKAAQKASTDAIAELTKACGEGYEWRNDLTHFWCAAKPAEAKK